MAPSTVFLLEFNHRFVHSDMGMCIQQASLSIYCMPCMAFLGQIAWKFLRILQNKKIILLLYLTLEYWAIKPNTIANLKLEYWVIKAEASQKKFIIYWALIICPALC